jgi:tetratricopeptide (TPR) repeat protein
MSNKQQVKALIQGQRWAEAKALCTQLCQTSPGDAETWFQLGAINGQLGAFDEAEVCCRRVIAIRPDVPLAHFNLGIALHRQGKVDDAAKSFREALRLKSDFVEAHSQLGAIFSQMKRLDEAVFHYRRVIEIRPDDVDALNSLAGTLLNRISSQDDFTEAEKCYRQALRYRADLPVILMNLSVLLRDTGRHDEAMEYLRRALGLKPGDADILASMAHIHEYKGEFEAGYALLKPLLDQDTDNYNVALSYAALARHIDQRDGAVALLERVLQQQPVHVQQGMHFKLGKLYDEMKEYDKAFAHYQQAHALEPARFDVKQNERSFDALVSIFNAENSARQPRASNRSRLPVFIVGMPRSGTSLVEQILASHPEVHGAGELGDIHHMTVSLPAILGKGTPYPECVDVLGQGQLDEIAQRHLDMLGNLSRTAIRVTDKMPHNFLALGLIDRLFPEARIIHCTRDPIDTCLSIYFLKFSVAHPYADDMTHLGVYYRQYLRLMAHWKSVLRVPILDVKYEDLVANQEAVSRRMVEFCGLEWDEQCLRFHESKRTVSTHSYDQVRRPLYKKSVARWKNYERHLGPLITALGDAIVTQTERGEP